MSDDKAIKGVLGAKADKEALAEAMDELGHTEAAQGQRQEAAGLGHAVDASANSSTPTPTSTPTTVPKT